MYKFTFFVSVLFLFSMSFSCEPQKEELDSRIPTNSELIGRWIDQKTYTFKIVYPDTSYWVTFKDIAYNINADGTFDIDNGWFSIDFMESGTWQYDEATATVHFNNILVDPDPNLDTSAYVKTNYWENVQITDNDHLTMTTVYHQVIVDGSLPVFHITSQREFLRE